jgi:carbon monoxide dehydrogenase subunit G
MLQGSNKRRCRISGAGSDNGFVIVVVIVKTERSNQTTRFRWVAMQTVKKGIAT